METANRIAVTQRTAFGGEIVEAAVAGVARFTRHALLADAFSQVRRTNLCASFVTKTCLTAYSWVAKAVRHTGVARLSSDEGRAGTLPRF